MNMPGHYEMFNSPVIISLSALFIPLFDALRVMLGRAFAGKSMFMPDRRHIHHKLLDLGFSHRKVMISLVLCAGMLVLVNVILQSFMDINLVFAFDMIVWIGSVQIINAMLRRKKSQSN